MTTDADRCSTWRSLASCRVDGELDELQTARLERHLLGCAECRSWLGEATAVAALIHDAEPVLPEWTLELRPSAVRRRGRAIAVGATTASAAAVAALAIAVPGSGVSLFSSASAKVSAAPCTSCTKKEAVTFAVPAPAHVTNPLVELQ